MTTLARVLLLLWLLVPSTFAAAKTQVSLLLSHTSAKPGETIMAGLRLNSEPGWHTYWRNYGDAGVATSIEWELPPGVTAGSIQWPPPEKMVLSKLYAYVFEKDTLLLIPITLASDIKPGPIELKGRVDWLECSDKVCVPQGGSVKATLIVGSESKISEQQTLIQSWRDRLPVTNLVPKVTASWEPGDAASRKLIIEWTPKATPNKPDFFPFETSPVVGAETVVLDATPDKVRLRKPAKLDEGTWPKEVHGIIIEDTVSENRKAFEVTIPIAPLPGDAPAAAASGSTGAIQLTGSGPSSLAAILGFAFLGGLILNVMPCVLPVIALKILGFVNQSREEPKRVRELGIIYMLGIIGSFVVLAGALLGARKAAGDVNWGMQMQNPFFVVGMLVLVTLVALNLWGVFEIILPGKALGAAGDLSSREGRAGAFYNGVLATLLATPCTAPFLGVAVGAVLTRSAYEVILTFVAIAIGLASPYVLLSWNPKWLKLLPKPGPWMEKFKIAMGFPMAATAVWLWSFGARHFGKTGGLWLGLFLVFLAFAAWVYGDFVQRGTQRRGLAAAMATLILVLGYTYTLEAKLHWRQKQVASTSSDEIVTEAGGIPWKRWSAEAVTKARAEGHPVLVDFTADWCFTCQVNKENAIEVDAVKAKLKEIDAVALLADFTLKDPKIGAEVRSFGRAGVPLVVVYPANPAAEPIVLPDGLFTAGTMLKALEQASKGGKAPGAEVTQASR